MAFKIKPDETDAESKRVRFSIFTDAGLITDAEKYAISTTLWAADTFVPGASDLKVGYDNVASSDFAGTFAYRKNGEWYYEFANAEVAASLGARTVYIEFAKTGYRSFVLRCDLVYDVENIKDNSIDNDAIDTSAVTEIQSGLATSSTVSAIDTKLGTPAGASISADIASVKSTADSIQTTVTELHKIGVGRWKIVNNQLILYDVDEVTPLRTFDLLDENEDPSMTRIFERVPV